LHTAMMLNSGIFHQTVASGVNMLIITTFGAIFVSYPPPLLKILLNGDAVDSPKKTVEAPRREMARENFMF